jgi:hypothetical protein
MKKYTFILFILLFNYAQSQSLDSLINKLSGKWDWEITEGGYGGLTNTPITEGFNLSIVFSQDSLNIGTDSISFQSLKNDTFICSGKIFIETNSCPGYPFHFYSDQTCVIPDIPYTQFTDYAIEISDTNLYLYDNCSTDGFYHKYCRDTLFTNNFKNQFSNQFIINTYPNPTHDIVYIHLPGKPKNLLIDILNLQGEILQKQHIYNSPKNVEINLSTFAPGLYFIKIIDDENNFLIKKVIRVC